MKAKFCLICAAIVAGVLIFMLSCSDKPEIAEAISTNSSAVHPRTAGFSDPPKLNGDRYEFRDLEHEGIVCDLGERNIGWQWDEENGQAFRSKTSYYANFFGSYELAEMESKYWNSSEAQWKPGQAKLEVTIDAYRRNDDCDQFLHEDETKDCNSCRKKYARINHGTYLGLGHCDGDVTGSFRKEIDNFVIDNEYSIDFECCL